jgi:hypothetical protein
MVTLVVVALVTKPGEILEFLGKSSEIPIKLFPEIFERKYLGVFLFWKFGFHKCL